MLRKIRMMIAIICFILVTLLFLDFSGFIHAWFGWLAKMQFFPALISSNIMIVGSIVLFTILFGRVYCSTICPLGVFQDVISWVAGKKRKRRFSYSTAKNILRFIVLAIFAVGAIVGIALSTSLLEPYSAYGRIASNLFSPIYKWGNNILAYFAKRMNSYAFYSVDVWMKSLVTFIVSLMTFVILGFMSWKKGRIYCNSICPVGTVLGLLSKFSLFKPRINEEKCTHCRLCEKNCKSSCIDGKSGIIDYSRCVFCFNCIDSCPQKVLQYSLPKLAKTQDK